MTTPLAGLLDLPTELLQYILLLLSTPSFVQASISCKALYELVSSSRNVVLYHLQHVPGIKIGLDDPTVTTADLFLLFRQRASKHLFGANFTANRLELKSRNAVIDADASCISELDEDYVTMSLVMKDTLTVRLYSSNLRFKEQIESPFCGGKAKILQVIHRKSTIAILYQWEAEETQESPAWMSKPLVKDHPYKKPNNLQTVSPPGSDVEDTQSDDEKEPPKGPKTLLFYLQVHKSLSAERPITYTILRHKGLVPRHLALCSKLQWAILWDSENALQPTDVCEIVQYNAPKHARYDGMGPESRVIWPAEYDIRPVEPSNADIDKGLIPKKPRKIRYFREGRRLALYTPGDVMPYQVLSVGPYRATNSILFENHTRFRVNTSFFGIHESYWELDEGRQYCHVSHLCLGIGEIWTGSNLCQVLCVLRSRSKTDHDDCPHTVELDRMSHVTAENCKAVARLWGWSSASSTLTGLDTVAISPGGTRIAISQWNRVLIWSLDPKMLCEDIVDFDLEEGGKKQKKKPTPQTSSVAEGFYDRVKDKHMGWKVANLKPIIIDLDGAVARKMSWTVQTESEEDESSTEGSSDEGTTQSSQSQDNMETIIEPMQTILDHPPQDLASLLAETEAIMQEFESTSQDHAKSKEDMNVDEEQKSSKDSDEKLQQSSIVTDHTGTSEPKAVPNRLSPSTTSQRSQTVIPDTEGTKAVETESVQTISELFQNVDVDNPATEEADIDIQDETMIEMIASPSSDGYAEPKGKEKEVTITTQDVSEMSEKSTARSESTHTTTRRHKKCFTENELVIMTDRGFQVWDFGVWSKGVRKTATLDENVTLLER